MDLGTKIRCDRGLSALRDGSAALISLYSSLISPIFEYIWTEIRVILSSWDYLSHD